LNSKCYKLNFRPLNGGVNTWYSHPFTG